MLISDWSSDVCSSDLIGDRGEIGERGAVAVHAVKAFDRDPRRSGAAAGAPARDDVVERLRVIVRGGDMAGAAELHPVVRTRMDEFVMDDEEIGRAHV